MKLFLSGGGSDKDSIELDKKFVASLDLSKPLLYIPIAINSKNILTKNASSEYEDNSNHLDLIIL